MKINSISQLPKLILFKDKIVITNYKKIINIETNTISLEDIVLKGSDLRLFELNKKDIVIKGIINEIKIN